METKFQCCSLCKVPGTNQPISPSTDAFDISEQQHYCCHCCNLAFTGESGICGMFCNLIMFGFLSRDGSGAKDQKLCTCSSLILGCGCGKIDSSKLCNMNACCSGFNCWCGKIKGCGCNICCTGCDAGICCDTPCCNSSDPKYCKLNCPFYTGCQSICGE